MGVYATLKYGIALTDQFGGRSKDVPKELFDFASNFEPYETEPPNGIVWMDSDEGPALVVGVGVATWDGDCYGNGWKKFEKNAFSLENPEDARALHQSYLEALQQLPEAMRALALKIGRKPRLVAWGARD